MNINAFLILSISKIDANSFQIIWEVGNIMSIGVDQNYNYLEIVLRSYNTIGILYIYIDYNIK